MHENFENSIRNVIIPPAQKVKACFKGFLIIIRIFLAIKNIFELQRRMKKKRLDQFDPCVLELCLPTHSAIHFYIIDVLLNIVFSFVLMNNHFSDVFKIRCCSFIFWTMHDANIFLVLLAENFLLCFNALWCGSQ